RNGRLLWARHFLFNPYGKIKGLAAAPEGIVAGGDVLRLDAAGNLVWAKYLNIDATYHFANIVSGDGKLVLGGTVWRAGVHGSDALVVSIALAGQNSKAIAIDVGATDSIGDVISTGGKMVAAGMTQRMGPTLEDTVHHK